LVIVRSKQGEKVDAITGADILRVMDVTRHREVSTLKTYDRRAKAFKQHAGDAFL